MNAKRATACDTERGAYRFFTPVTLRYGDTDRQGHVNNAVYCTLYESGRVDFLFTGEGESLAGGDTAFVIAAISLDYLQELNFPGTVEVASKILSLGKSSFEVGQAIFIGETCFSSARSVIVVIDEQSKKTSPMQPQFRKHLESL